MHRCTDESALRLQLRLTVRLHAWRGHDGPWGLQNCVTMRPRPPEVGPGFTFWLVVGVFVRDQDAGTVLDLDLEGCQALGYQCRVPLGCLYGRLGQLVRQWLRLG